MASALLFALAALAAIISLVGIVQVLAGWVLVRRFAAAPHPAPSALPPVSVLKPLHGDEPLLEAALASICEQDYPAFQIVFGVQDAADPALAAVAAVRARFAHVDIAVVADATPHGANRKVANLINMLPAARHDVLVIADSDIHAGPDYLRRVIGALERPGVGLATTLYTGRAAQQRTLAARLGITGIAHYFLPGAMLGRALGRQDCLGATMAIRRATLDAVGGFPALSPYVADDAVLGGLVRSRGLSVALAGTVPETTVAEADLPALLRHELRWARTTRTLAPVAFAASIVQFPLVWSLAALLLAGGAAWAWVLLVVCWVIRAAAARGIDAALGHAAPLWLLPLREALSVCVLLAAYAGDEVHWRGEVLRVAAPRSSLEGESLS